MTQLARGITPAKFLFPGGPLFGKKDKSLPTLLAELKQLTVDYAKQETLDPLKGLARYIGAGIAGSLLLGIGFLLWALAMLRALQHETGSTFTGHLSWAPYFITLLACAVVALLAISAIGKEKRKADKHKAEREARQRNAEMGNAK